MKIEVWEGVYPPSEDTYLLASFLERIPLKGKKVLDMGCGSGYIGIAALKKGANVTFVDIDKRAVENTRHNLRLNNLNAPVIESDLFENIEGTFDIIVFNPPYLETGDEVKWWDGGSSLIERFLQEAPRHLTREGRLLLITEGIKPEFGCIYGRKYLWNLWVWELRRCP